MYITLDNALKKFISSIEFTDIPGAKLEYRMALDAKNLYEICISGVLNEAVAIGDWRVTLKPAFDPDFYYTPHLTPTEDSVVDMHVFRTPAMIMGLGDKAFWVMPVVDNVPNTANRWYTDLDAPNNTMTLGITTTELWEHILYRRTGKAVLPAGEFSFVFRVRLLEGDEAKNPFRSALHDVWARYGSHEVSILPEYKDLMPYVKHTYDWAFDRWAKHVWQEFDLNGIRVGAPQMVVNVFQSPNYTQPFSVREPLAIWNQAWFSSLRSAMGLFRYAKQTGNEDYLKKALMTKELALQFPQDNGLFDAVIGVANVPFEVDGKTYYRGGDWKDHYWGNSSRNPASRDMAKAPKHILDMSWTGLQMLSWYSELEKDERLLDYSIRYADRLITLQDDEGFFPAWIDKDGNILDELRQSPECGVSVTFLIELYKITGKQAYLDSAMKCMDVLIEKVMPESRWEDFETYWSCSTYGMYDLVGKKVERNARYKECSLSPFYMAQALYACYMQTKDGRYLTLGERCMDELLMYQSSFQPSYMPIAVVGGFGVMNCDGELNDGRQNLFAELILQYGEALNRPEYTERGYAALRASFTMMYCPENPVVKVQWEKRWPFFNEKDYGFMMENYGHNGYADSNSLGIGEFTLYDWCNGGASEAVMRVNAHFGHK